MDQFRYRAAVFFDRVTPEMIDRELGETPPGEALPADPLFSGRDARWRLERPMPGADDPDALEIAPRQAHYLIKPGRRSAYGALVLVGLEEAGKIGRPALAGLLTEPRRSLFTIEPVAPEACAIEPGEAARLADEIIETQGDAARD